MRNSDPAGSVCGIGVIGVNPRQVFIHSPGAGAYRATVEQDQTLIERMTPIAQKPSIRGAWSIPDSS